MSRSITVLVTATNEDRKSAAFQIGLGATSWEKFEQQGAIEVVKTKKGNYLFRGAGGTGTTGFLRPRKGRRLGALYSLNPDQVAEGATDRGLSDDAGSGLTWKGDKIIDI